MREVLVPRKYADCKDIQTLVNVFNDRTTVTKYCMLYFLRAGFYCACAKGGCNSCYCYLDYINRENAKGFC